MNEFEPDYVVPTVVIAADAYAELLNERDALAAQNEALAAQVAALVAAAPCYAARPGEMTYECRVDRLCYACALRSDPPAAAAVYLAAMRVAERLHRDMQSEEWQIVSSGHQSAAVDDAMADWRKAAGK